MVGRCLPHACLHTLLLQKTAHMRHARTQSHPPFRMILLKDLTSLSPFWTQEAVILVALLLQPPELSDQLRRPTAQEVIGVHRYRQPTLRVPTNQRVQRTGTQHDAGHLLLDSR